VTNERENKFKRTNKGDRASGFPRGEERPSDRKNGGRETKTYREDLPSFDLIGGGSLHRRLKQTVIRTGRRRRVKGPRDSNTQKKKEGGCLGKSPVKRIHQAMTNKKNLEPRIYPGEKKGKD